MNINSDNGIDVSKEYAIKMAEVEAGLTALLNFIGDDPEREGLKDTPKRVRRAFMEFARGLQEPMPEMTIFNNEQDGIEYDELIVVKDIELISLCEHHLLPFIGVAHIGYLPDKILMGLSKAARVADWCARRPQVQERLTRQILDILVERLQPIAAAVVIEAKHMCMSCRGVKKSSSLTSTAALHGKIKHDPAMRSEFYKLIGM